MAYVLVDTDILIDVSRNESSAINYLSALEKNLTLAISSVTHMELIVGCRNKAEFNNLQKFLRRFSVFHITDQVSELAVNLLALYNLSHGLLIPDALIAATAIIWEESFVTKNQRDFRFIEGLNLLNYRQVI